MLPDSSTNRLRIGIATEGPASKAVVESLCRRAGVVHRALNSQGKERLFRDFDKLLNALRVDFAANRFLVVPDLHPELDCIAEVVRWRAKIGQRFPQAILCLAIWEMESWLLADAEAFKAYLGFAGALPVPDQIGGTKPSVWIHEAFRQIKGYSRGAAFDKRTDGAKIAEMMDLGIAVEKSLSLRRFLAQIH